VGYRAFYFYQIQIADLRLESKILASDISSEKLITIKIPLNLPYLTDWADYQSMEGEVVYKKETYRYIKKKIARDTAFLICVDHHEKSKLEKNSDEFFNKVNDITSDGAKKETIKLVKNDFFENSTPYEFLKTYSYLNLVKSVFTLLPLNSVFLETDHNPPEYNS
jgi:hypothetical protein